MYLKSKSKQFKIITCNLKRHVFKLEVKCPEDLKNSALVTFEHLLNSESETVRNFNSVKL